MGAPFTLEQLEEEIARQEFVGSHVSKSSVISKAIADNSANSEEEAAVDIIEYVQASWGLDSTPYPIQRCIFKLIYGLPLKDSCPECNGVGVIEVPKSSTPHCQQILEKVCPKCEGKKKEGDTLSKFRDIFIWDRFREKIEGEFTEREFVDYLYEDGRCNISPEDHDKQLGSRPATVVLRLGRRSGKTTMSQWITAYEIYRLVRLKCPQAYYRIRPDQPISITVVATGKEQSQTLLEPSRNIINRSPYLKRFVDQDSLQKISLATPYSLETGAGSRAGIQINAAPCSAKHLRGKANIIALLEEFGTFFYELKGSNKSDTAIYAALQPSTIDFKNPVTHKGDGLVLIVSTPLTKESYMYEVEQNIRDKKMVGLVLHLPSYWINPNLDSTELRGIYESDRLMFQREYEADYLDKISSAFTFDDLEALRRPVDSDANIIRYEESAWMGVDLGIKNDGTSISVVAANSEGRYRLVVHEVYRTDIGKYENYEILPIEEMAKRIDEIWNFYGVKGGIFDMWNCYGLESYLESGARKNLIHLEMNQTANDRIARNMISVVQQGMLTIYGDKQVWNDEESVFRELIKLHRIQSSGDPPKIKLSAPNVKGFHDDQYSSLSRAIWAAKEGTGDHPFVELGRRGGNSPVRISQILRERAEALRRQKTFRGDRQVAPNGFMQRIRRS